MSSPVLCSFGDCEEPATHYPGVFVWAKGRRRGSHPPTVLIGDVPMCEGHAKDRSTTWLTDDMRNWCADMMKRGGLTEPGWGNMDVRAVSIEKGDHPHPRTARGAMPHTFTPGSKPQRCSVCGELRTHRRHTRNG